MLPVNHFRWHAAQALVGAATGDAETAISHAERALEAAGRDHSGLRYRPSVGLVPSQYDDVIRNLEALCAAQ